MVVILLNIRVVKGDVMGPFSPGEKFISEFPSVGFREVGAVDFAEELVWAEHTKVQIG